MNIHEHQAKQILKEYGAPISNGVVIQSLDQFSIIFVFSHVKTSE